MLLKRELLEQIRDGQVDVIFRRWNRPSVKPGGTLKTKLGVLHIVRMDAVDPDQVSDEDARRAGLGDRAGFEHWLKSMKDGALFHRMEVRLDPTAG